MSPESVLRGRRDIKWQLQLARRTGERHWSAFDPLTRTSYRCGEPEHWLFHQLDGHRSLRQICSTNTAPRAFVELNELLGLARMLVARGIVQSVGPFDTLADSQVRAPQRSWLQWLSRSVSWRVRGIDPHRFLRWLAPHTDIFLSPAAARAWLLFSALALLLVLADFSRLVQQATLWQWLMQPTSGTSLFVIFILTRGLHELGHALILTRLGGRCPDIGLIFMLGAPCAYCDVTESWRLPSARQRAAVAAGGMYIELIIASLAALLWLATVDGTVNTLALQTMVVCSISTCLINANPLMRFDGYYILSDWLDEPNLRTRADQCLLANAKRWILGAPVTSELAYQPKWRQCGLALFSLAGCLYRLSLSWMMAILIVSLYTAWNLALFGRIFAILLLFTWWMIPAMKLAQNLMASARTLWARVRLAALAAWLVLMTCTIPLPSREFATGWVQPAQMQGLFAPAAATLQSVAKQSGDEVHAGQILFQLADSQPTLRAIELSHAAEKARVQLVSLRRQRYFAESVQMDLKALESAAQGTVRQAAHAQAAVDRLAVHATIAGTLISLPAPALLDIENRPATAGPQLWLDKHQVGRLVSTGAMLGAVCSHERMAVIPLDDEQLHDICAGTSVRLHLPSTGQQVWRSHVSAVVRVEQLDSVARLLAESDQVHQPVETGSPTAKELSSAGYAAIVPLPCPDAHVNAEVSAVFRVPAQTLAQRTTKWLRSNARWLLP